MPKVRPPARKMEKFLERTKGVSSPDSQVCVVLVTGFYDGEVSAQTGKQRPNTVEATLLTDKVEWPLKIKAAAPVENKDEEPPSKKAKVIDDEDEDENEENENVGDPMEVSEVQENKTFVYDNTLKSGDFMYISTFQKPIPKDQKFPFVAQICVNASVYMDRLQFSCKEVTILSQKSPCDIEMINQYIGESGVCSFPLVEKFNPGTKRRFFILPLSENKQFTITDIQRNENDWKDRNMFTYVDKENPNLQSVGIHVRDGTNMRNQFSVDYVKETVGADMQVNKEACIMTYGYKQTLFESFGVLALDHWKAVAPVLLTCAQDCFAFGSAKLENLNKLTYTRLDKVVTDGAEQQLAVGFLIELSVNMVKTIQNTSYPISKDFAKQCVKDKKLKDVITHPLNMDYEDKLRGTDPYFDASYAFNLSEMSLIARSDFFTIIEDEENPINKEVSYFALLDYEEEGMDEIKFSDPECENIMKEKNIKPALVFAIATKKM